mgnify:CR=1 FL=1
MGFLFLDPLLKTVSSGFFSFLGVLLSSSSAIWSAKLLCSGSRGVEVHLLSSRLVTASVFLGVVGSAVLLIAVMGVVGVSGSDSDQSVVRRLLICGVA